MTIRKNLDMINNLLESEQLNESFNKGDSVKVKDDVKNPQIKKFAGKQAKVLSTEDDGKTIHAKVKGAKHGSMEFKSSELESLNENLNEDVDTDAAKKDLHQKMTKLKNAIEEFKNLDDNTGQLFLALPKGLSQLRDLNKSFAEIEKELESVRSKLDNAQDWDKNKL